MHNSVSEMGKLIRKERKNQKMTVATLAEKSNVTAQTIMAFEKGVREDLAVQTLLGILDALSLSADYLMGTGKQNGTWDERISVLSEYDRGAIDALYEYLRNNKN